MIDGLADAAASGDEAAGDDRPLRDCVDLSVGAAQGSHQQHAALQIAGIADGGGGDIDFRAGLRERLQRAGHHHGRHVGDADGVGGNRDAHPLQHVGQTLSAEDGGPLVAGAGEPDHQPIADELVVANAFDGDQIFQACAPAAPSGSSMEIARQQHESDKRMTQKGRMPSSRRYRIFGRRTASPTTPLPFTRISISATWVEGTVFAVEMSAVRTMPRTVIACCSELT